MKRLVELQQISMEHHQGLVFSRSHSQMMTSSVNSIAQKAALAALTGPTDALDEMVRSYENRRTWLVDAINAIPGMHSITPDGAFYIFPSVSGWIGKTTASGIELTDDVIICEWLLEETGVALVP